MRGCRAESTGGKTCQIWSWVGKWGLVAGQDGGFIVKSKEEKNPQTNQKKKTPQKQNNTCNDSKSHIHKNKQQKNLLL